MSLQNPKYQLGNCIYGDLWVNEIKQGTNTIWPETTLLQEHGMVYAEDYSSSYGSPEMQISPSLRVSSGYWQSYDTDRGYMRVVQGNYVWRSQYTMDYHWSTPYGKMSTNFTPQVSGEYLFALSGFDVKNCGYDQSTIESYGNIGYSFQTGGPYVNSRFVVLYCPALGTSVSNPMTKVKVQFTVDTQDNSITHYQPINLQVFLEKNHTYYFAFAVDLRGPGDGSAYNNSTALNGTEYYISGALCDIYGPKTPISLMDKIYINNKQLQKEAELDDYATAIVNITSDLDLDLYLTLHSDDSITINWGDGNIEEFTGTFFTRPAGNALDLVGSNSGYAVHALHSYATSGTYTIFFITNTETYFSPGTYFNSSDYGLLGVGSVTGKTNYPDLTVFTIGFNTRLLQSYAFSGCDALTAITLPATITQIAPYVFSGCTGLIEINIIGYKHFGSDCFSGSATNTNIVKINISNIETWLSCDFDSSNSNPFYLFGQAGLYVNNQLLTDIIVPSFVNKIRRNCFAYCQTLESITINSTVELFDPYAFVNCSNLTKVYCDSIENWIKRGSTSGGPLSNGASLYENNNLITNIVIPNDITKVPNYIFQGCTSIQSVTMPNNITEIGNYAFANSSIQTIQLSSVLTDIQGYAFQKCSSLQNIILPSSLVNIGNYAFSECINLQAISFPSSVLSIGSYAFYKCNTLTEVIIPSTINNLKSSSFRECTALQNVEIGAFDLNDYILQGCTALEKVWLRSSIDNGGAYLVKSSNQNCILYIEGASLSANWHANIDVYDGAGTSSKPYVRLTKVYNQTTSPF